MEEGQSPPRPSGASPAPVPSGPGAAVGPYSGPVPPGGWHEPIPSTPVPGQLAGWPRRAGAALLDAALVLLPATLLVLGIAALVAGPGGGISFSDGETGVVVGILVAIVSLIFVAVAVLVTALVYAPLTMRRRDARNGQTWGKQLLGIRVVRMNGVPQTFTSAAVREVLVKLLLFGAVGATIAAIPTILDLLWPLWDREGRALHDMVVDTRVVRA
jgi:uncharacterized RDD family membrane protein YckC